MEQFKGQPRLPKFAVPKRYDVRLKPDLTACKFGGSVAIDLDIVSDTRFIVLNAAELSVNTGSVTFTHKDSSKVFKPLKVETFEEDGILVLEFGETLPSGPGVLAIGFEGILNDKMKGFYRSSYEHNGEKKNMAVTQFEPVDARRCFPCWDEPAWKATFKITLDDVPSALVALSNMPVVEEKVDGHLKTVSYQETPIMSTYLVAVVVGLFDYVEDHTSDGIKVRVYCQVGKANQGKFALNVAVKTLELYKEYFAVPYPLPKLDMVAIPDFSAGAMENYGLVTYRETALLFDEQHSAAANKQRVATVVAHELAHQWFGNLVTMEWWTHLWLNEGFATWVSYLAADSLFPEWKIWTQFLDESTEGLRLDGLEESHPIEVEINHACEVDEIFDAISYRKGASVIRMLQSYLGAEPFQRSLASYIKKHAYSNAKTEDLWAALEEGSSEPVNKLMNSWTKQQGYPVVSVKVKDQKLEFDQTQFLSSGSEGTGQWIVPITLCCGSYDVRKSFLLQTKSETLDIKEFLGCSVAEIGSGSTCSKNNAQCSWIKLNVDRAGFYRVKYDEKLAAQLRNAIEKKYLSATDRYGILDDSAALSMARQQSFVSLLTLLGAYREELDYTVLSNLITISYKLTRIAADAVPELLGLINQFFIGLLQYSAEKLGWQPKPGESHLDAMLRGEILTALASFGHDLTIDEAIRRFNAFLDDRNTPLLPPDIRRAAYVAVMKRVSVSNRSGYESLLRVYRETDLSQEKTRILGSLALCPDPDIILEVLNFLLTSEVRSQDAVFGLAVSSKGRETAWTWLKDNWEHISKTWGSGFLITRFVSATVSPFASLEKVKEVEEFFKVHPNPAITRTLKQSIERVQINAKWVGSIQGEKNLADAVTELAYRKYYQSRCQFAFEIQSLYPNGAVQGPSSASEVRRAETLRHKTQTRPHRLQIRRFRRHRPRYRRRYPVHCSQCCQALRQCGFRVFHSTGLFQGVFKPSKVEIFEEDGILVMEFEETLPLGLGVLAIGFEGILNDNMKGFYRSTYEHNGEKKNMAVTQFEPVDARRCFPCWDEPACKATFTITLEDVPSELVALSNMPVVEEKVNGHLKTVSYLESPIMSTYLVAIVVGLFDYVEDHTSDGVKVRVYCQVGKENQGKFALHVAVKTLELYKEYFAVPYSLPKLDMVAIPDFSAGAMENYGLVTYRETALLFDDQHSSASSKQNVTITVAHELAHQWFGNLVTMEWWTHLWLNEGFATWVSYLATESLFPEWKIWTQFLDESTEGLRLDGLEESHPIEVEINHAGEVDEIFDAISYTKGASVIRMLQNYLGAECFQRSLASYIKKHAYSNAKTEDLWASLEEGSGEPVNKLMNSWTQQKGYPVVSVKVIDQKLEFDQTQFLSSGSQCDGQWIVPITLCCGSYDVRKSFLLKTKSETIDIKEFLGCSIAETESASICNKNKTLCSWIKINVDQAGFYRVKYDEKLAATLRNAIQNKHLSATDRFGILDDSYALSMARQLSFASLLTLLAAYREELDYTVLSNLISISRKLARIAADAVPDLLDLINQFFIGLLQYSAEKLGWQPKAGESHLDAMLRGEILTTLALFGHDLTINETSRRFHAFLDDRNTPLLPPDIRKSAYVAVMQRVTQSSRAGYDSLLRVYRESDQSEEKNRILDPDIILEVLNFLLTSEVRNQDVIFGLAVSSKGRETAWTWLKDNWEQISKTWGSGFLITRFVSAIVSPLASFERVEEVEFFKAHPNPAITRTLKQSIERVQINAKLVQSVQGEKDLADVLKELTYRKN